jgi:hypothetical protein
MKETKHLDYLDGWRGMSILFVLGGQFWLWPSSAAALDDAERKVQECRSNSQSLIGLDRDELRSRCGPWDSVDVISVQNRRVETLTWGNPKTNPLLVIYVGDGKVTAAQPF